jgi:hypothetical protein
MANLGVSMTPRHAEDDRTSAIIGRVFIKTKAEVKGCQFFVDFHRQQK